MNKVDKNKRHEERKNPYDNKMTTRLILTGSDGRPEVRELSYKEFVNIHSTLMSCARSFDTLCQRLFRTGKQFRDKVRGQPPMRRTKQFRKPTAYTGEPRVDLPNTYDKFIVSWKGYSNPTETQEEYNEQLADIFIARGLSAFLWMI